MKRWLIAGALSVLLTAAVYLPVCNLVFRCGCTWFFLEGSAHCNIHNPAPPHCPVCVGEVWNALGFGILIAAAFFIPLSMLLSRGKPYRQ